jgi:hypothetical protein
MVSLAGQLFDLVSDDFLTAVESVLGQEFAPAARAVRVLDMARNAIDPV